MSYVGLGIVVLLSLTVLSGAAYAGGPDVVSAVLIGDGSSTGVPVAAGGSGSGRGSGGSWEPAVDTPWGGVISITPAPADYVGEGPHYISPPVIAQAETPKEPEAVGKSLKWRMNAPVEEKGAVEATAAAAGAPNPAVPFFLGSSAVWWVGLLGCLLIVALVVFYLFESKGAVQIVQKKKK